MEKIKKGAPIRFDPKLSQDAQNLIVNLLTYDQNKRPGMDYIFGHTWVKSYEKIFGINIQSIRNNYSKGYAEGTSSRSGYGGPQKLNPQPMGMTGPTNPHKVEISSKGWNNVEVNQNNANPNALGNDNDKLLNKQYITLGNNNKEKANENFGKASDDREERMNRMRNKMDTYKSNGTSANEDKNSNGKYSKPMVEADKRRNMSFNVNHPKRKVVDGEPKEKGSVWGKFNHFCCGVRE